MQQILRLMYVDQMTPVNAIFRMEERDSPNRRQAVGDLLCGVLDERIYPSQIKARNMEREYAEVASEFSGLLRVLRRVEENLDFSDLLSKMTATEEARNRALNDIEALRVTRYSAGQVQSEDSPVLEALRRDLDKVSRDVVATQRDLDRLVLAIEDAALLIEDLEKNLVHISQAQATGEILGPLVFTFCPSCLTPVTGGVDAHHCHLCKSEIDEKHESSRYARLKNELEMQLRESTGLQQKRLNDKSKLEEHLGGLQRIRNLLSDDLLNRSRHYLTETDAEIEALTRSVGYYDRELIDLDRERRLAVEVTELSERKRQLNNDLQGLKENIAVWTSAKERRQAAVYGLVSRMTADLLAGDLPSDIELVTQEGVRFDFSDNAIVINEKRGYSASSRTIIKNSFHLAMIFASCTDSRMKYPRFLLIDNIEDKGMTMERSHNFQRLIRHFSENTIVDHQIIFTTSMPEDTLEDARYTVGERYTETRKSLDFL